MHPRAKQSLAIYHIPTLLLNTPKILKQIVNAPKALPWLTKDAGLFFFYISLCPSVFHASGLTRGRVGPSYLWRYFFFGVGRLDPTW